MPPRSDGGLRCQGLLRQFLAPVAAILLAEGSFGGAAVDNATAPSLSLSPSPLPYVLVPKYNASGSSGGGPATNLTVVRFRHRNLYLLWSVGLDLRVVLPEPTPEIHRSAVVAPHPVWATSLRDNDEDDNDHIGAGRYRRARPSRQARRRGADGDCCYASNAGPYDSDDAPVGTVVVAGRRRRGAFGPADVGVGQATTSTTGAATGAGGPAWVLGALPDLAAAWRHGVTDFVTGLDGGWLVYDGRSVVVATSSTTTGAPPPVRAPRTAVGVDALGRLLLLVADGAERGLWDQGLTLHEVADIFVAEGVTHAINLDGGGSSVLANHGRVISRPTCLDVSFLVCERPVATVLCLPCPGDGPAGEGRSDNGGAVPAVASLFSDSGRVPVADRYLRS